MLCSFVFPCCSFFTCSSFCRYHSFFVVSLVFCGGVLFSVVLFIFPCCPLFVVVRVFRGVRFLSWCCSIFPCHSFFCVVDSSALFVLPCCPFFQCSEGVFRVVSFSVLLVFCGVIRFSVQCGGFPRSSFFRVVRLRRVPVPYVRLLATPLPYVRLLCYYHHTITEHGERVDPLSYEIPVYRKQGWWAEQSRIMERMILKQRRKLTSAVWDDDIMKTSELMRWNNGNVP